RLEHDGIDAGVERPGAARAQRLVAGDARRPGEIDVLPRDGAGAGPAAAVAVRRARRGGGVAAGLMMDAEEAAARRRHLAPAVVLEVAGADELVLLGLGDGIGDERGAIVGGGAGV